ncbi:MAG: recombinase family protein [Paludibacteraceae bacterium]|nr:recombinase family protein [Paludibacteraceae bacterium]
MKKRRAAKYKRVSHKEQALKGFSLDAQDEILDKFAKDNNLIVVGDYVDRGITASTLKRPALQQLLEDLKAGEIDVIIFTKLDRWFRSVSHYYKIQEILDTYDVPWRAVLEDYNTETADGKFKVNIMLSVAQQERDRTSERIKVVFDSKIKKGQPITGMVPFGFKIEPHNDTKRVVIDESKKEIVLDLFTHYEIHQSVGATLDFIINKHDISIAYNSLKNMLKNTMYMGKYRDVENYCEAFISPERFEKIQRIMSDRNRNFKRKNNTYIFSGLLRCKHCGSSLAGTSCYHRNKYYYYYRCNFAFKNKQCTGRVNVSESAIEKYLLENIERKLEDYIVQGEVQNIEIKKPTLNKSKIKSEIKRLNTMYQKGRIEDDEYDKEYEKLQAKLKLCEEQPTEVDLNPLKEFLNNDFKTLYESLTREEQRSLWRSIIREMTVQDYENIDIDFLK